MFRAKPSSSGPAAAACSAGPDPDPVPTPLSVEERGVKNPVAVDGDVHGTPPP